MERNKLIFLLYFFHRCYPRFLLFLHKKLLVQSSTFRRWNSERTMHIFLWLQPNSDPNFFFLIDFPFSLRPTSKLKLGIHLFLFVDKSNRHTYRSSHQQWTSGVGKCCNATLKYVCHGSIVDLACASPCVIRR